MMKERRLILTALITFCLTATLFRVLLINGESPVGTYDAWYDVNDDGRIDILDIVKLTARYGTTGTPINKTELILDLQERVNALEQAQNHVKTLRFYNSTLTTSTSTDWLDAGRFTWTPANCTNNAIIDGACYCQYVGHFEFQVIIDGLVMVGTSWSSDEYQWLPVYEFVMYPNPPPNQINYTISFQIRSLGGSIGVKDVNVLLQVMDGLPPS